MINAGKTCRVKNCKCRAHARGYCASHYGQVWRNGRVAPTKTPKGTSDLEIMEAELRGATRVYDRVIGFKTRLYWSKRIREIQAAIKEHKEKGA